MAGLEVLYTCFGGSVTCPQDAVVCFVHWEMIKSGYRCVGSGDEPRNNDKKSELLPADWSATKELYSLRYKPKDGDTTLLLKAIVVDSTLIFNLMSSSTQQVSDLTVNISDHVDAEQLQTFDRLVFGRTHTRRTVLKDQFPSTFPSAAPSGQTAAQRTERRSRRDEDEEQRRRGEDSDPLRIPNRHPRQGTQPNWSVICIFHTNSRGGGGMIMDPLRSGYPRSGFDPSSGIPDILPPGAVPSGARFDPFGPVGRHRPGPDRDHMPPPGYDDMFM
uniref:Proteasome inhibitor PI31 subunit n=1 Tax=Labrus bergylta TaxID=56723 RepID=A0A3Q3EJZ7_9LABR